MLYNQGDRYQALIPSRTNEKQSSFEGSELELQARWFAGEFGRRFKSTENEEVEIVQFGIWNRENGPDFAEAAVSINNAKPIRGHIEIDREFQDWERHGHSNNPNYENVILHVVTKTGNNRFFTRTARNRNVQQIVISPDSSKSPFPFPELPAQKGRCITPLQNLPIKNLQDLLETAAQHRMHRKSANFARLKEAHGFDEALYQLLSVTLGYKSNKFPFTLLAQRLPLKLLQKRGIPAESLLFGVSGFLNTPDLSRFSNEAQKYLRELWENWWKHRTDFERLVIPKASWKMSGMRPQNHPHRRVGALCQLVNQWTTLRKLTETWDFEKLGSFLADLEHPYWTSHYTLKSKPASKPTALIGSSRIHDMFANVFYPIALLDDPSHWPAYLKLRAPLKNSRVEVAAARLFGSDPQKKKILSSVCFQQGLLQIYEDFCMQDNTGCEHCVFPEQITQWR